MFLFQVTANETRICDIDMKWPGKAHDSRVYMNSEVKVWLEEQVPFTAAADSAYCISRVLVKPFTQNESANDPRKRLFNRRLSGLRTVMTENIFGRWVKRFPIIKDLRTFLTQSQKTILATAILQNIAVHWDEDDVDVADDAPHDDGDDGGGEDEGDEGRINVRTEGQMLRETLMVNMPA
jgi:hypothetical protein